MTVANYLAKFLKEKNIDPVFVVQGGMITRLIDAIHHEGGTKIVSVHHEQAAAFAADAYARVTNKPGVAFATSGPGATNLITGIGSCYFDSVPAVFITGQVNLNEQKGKRKTRQIGFQETEIVPIVRPVTKAAYSIKKPDEIPFVLEEAYQIATKGRPGPVLIDIPMNVQNQEIGEVLHQGLNLEGEVNKDDVKNFYSKFLDVLKESKRPLVLAGRGIPASGTTGKFRQMIEKLNLPVVTSLLGFDVLPYDHHCRIGFIGTYGNRWANFALGSTDLLLVLGSRLDLRQTGSDINSFKKGKKIFHVDIDNAELNNRIKGCTVIKSDLSNFFDITESMETCDFRISAWRDEILEKYTVQMDTDELNNINGINPNIFIHQLSHASKAAKAITTDVGNNQMWTSQSYELVDGQIFISSGGMGAMGYSLPSAIGACIASGNSPVLCISGDGGFQINIQELQTIKRNNLPIKIVVLNNHCLGMIRQFQDSYFDSCYQATVWGYDTPDFVKVARAYGIESYSIAKQEEIENGLSKLWGSPSDPFLLEIKIDIFTNVYPKILFGNPITVMDPLIKKV